MIPHKPSFFKLQSRLSGPKEHHDIKINIKKLKGTGVPGGRDEFTEVELYLVAPAGPK